MFASFFKIYTHTWGSKLREIVTDSTGSASLASLHSNSHWVLFARWERWSGPLSQRPSLYQVWQHLPNTLLSVSTTAGQSQGPSWFVRLRGTGFVKQKNRNNSWHVQGAPKMNSEKSWRGPGARAEDTPFLILAQPLFSCSGLWRQNIIEGFHMCSLKSHVPLCGKSSSSTNVLDMKQRGNRRKS